MNPSPVYGVLQNASMVDFPGKLAAVFFLTGCNFTCGFCHNAALMGRVDAAGLPWTEVERICRKFRDNWVEGAVVTGGEPTLNPGVFQVVEKLREWGIADKCRFHISDEPHGDQFPDYAAAKAQTQADYQAACGWLEGYA